MQIHSQADYTATILTVTNGNHDSNCCQFKLESQENSAILTSFSPSNAGGDL